MARPDIGYYALIAGIGYIGYKVALDGKFGTEPKKWAIDLHNALSPDKPLAGGSTPVPITGGTGGTFTKCAGGTTVGAIMAWNSNGNLPRQMAEWQAERKAKKENPYDWAAFRAHSRGIGAADPGGNPPYEFCAFS